MNEQEERAFRLAIAFFQKWRETVIETDEQWTALADDVHRYVVESDSDHCMLARHLIEAVMDTLNDLYKDGRKPMPANYFGRDDI